MATTSYDSYKKSPKDNEILRKGSSFSAWRAMLEGALIKEDCVGHVFHDIDWEAPAAIPVKATEEHQSTFLPRLREFMKKDQLAQSIIIARLDDSVRPDLGNTRKTAKEIMDIIEATYRPIITVDIHTTIKRLHSVKLMGNNTLQYCEGFQQRLPA